MERIRVAHPILRSLVLAVLLTVPLMGGALTLGAHPMPVFVGGTVAGIVGALLFGGLVRWLPPLAFALVIVPCLVAAVPVFGWLVALLLSIGIGGGALMLFYRRTPPEPPRPRTSPYQRRDETRAPGSVADHGRTQGSSGRDGYDRRS